MTIKSNKTITHLLSPELVPGALVVCTYRMPSIHQPWIHDIPLGVIHAPGTDPLAWNGYNSEAYYCAVSGTIPVSYPFGKMHECVCNLVPVTPEQAALTGRPRVQFFMGAVALWELDRHSHPSREESEAYWRHLEDLMPPGTFVVCCNGLSISPLWGDEVQIGSVEAPETDEEATCKTQQQVVRVRCGKEVRYEPVATLMPISPEQAALVRRERISYFLGAVAAWHYDHQMNEELGVPSTEQGDDEHSLLSRSII